MSAAENERTVELGRIVGTHGVRGEVRVENWLDAPLWKGLKSCRAGSEERALVSFRPHKDFMLVKFQGVDDMDTALTLRGRVLTVPRSALHLAKNQILYADLYGFEVYDLREARVIGTLREVRESPAAMLYAVADGAREYLIPAIPAFERGIDWDARRLNVETIDGMLD